MIARIIRSVLIAGAMTLVVWVVAAIVIVLDSIMPIWIPGVVFAVAAVLEFFSAPVLDRWRARDEERSMRELAKLEALAELDAMSDKGLTER